MRSLGHVFEGLVMSRRIEKHCIGEPFVIPTQTGIMMLLSHGLLHSGYARYVQVVSHPLLQTVSKAARSLGNMRESEVLLVSTCSSEDPDNAVPEKRWQNALLPKDSLQPDAQL